MHPIISATVADQRRAELLRSVTCDRRLRESLPEFRPNAPRRSRVPAAALLLRGWLVRG
jgi:hypothetical protein